MMENKDYMMLGMGVFLILLVLCFFGYEFAWCCDEGKVTTTTTIYATTTIPVTTTVEQEDCDYECTIRGYDYGWLVTLQEACMSPCVQMVIEAPYKVCCCCMETT